MSNLNVLCQSILIDKAHIALIARIWLKFNMVLKMHNQACALWERLTTNQSTLRIATVKTLKERLHLLGPFVLHFNFPVGVRR